MSTRRVFILVLIATTGALSGQSFTFVDVYFDGTATIDGLADAFASAVSPDGSHVYVCSGLSGAPTSDNALAVFSRAADGRLTFLEVHFDDDDGGSADGLDSCRDLIVSPDGAHVYTAGSSDDAIGIFVRNPGTGALTFDSVVEDGVGLDGLAGVQALALTADGLDLFAIGRIDDAIVAFSRNPGTGALTFEDSEFDGIVGVSGLDRPLDVAVSPDGGNVYVASGSNTNFTGSDAVAAFAWNATNDELTFIDSYFEGAVQGANTIDGLDRVNGIAVSGDGSHVYTSGSVDPAGEQDWIAIFDRAPATGSLLWAGSISHFTHCDLDIVFDFETYLSLHPSGTRLFFTSAMNALVEFTRTPATGALTFTDAECYFDRLELGINLPRRHSLDPTGTHLYQTAQADDSVAVFDTDGIFADGFESGDVSAWSASVP